MADRTPWQWVIAPFRRYAVFKGRSPRAEYWWFYLGTLIVDRLLGFLDRLATGADGLLTGIFWLVAIVPWFAVAIRRLHDTDRSGWWLMLFFGPLLAMVGVAIVNAFAGGSDGMPIAFWICFVAAGLGGLAIFIFTVMPGTAGPNRFGADPYGPDHLEEIFA